ncbi:MAG: 27 kDa antigen Cfp30B [Frondihabitans sp.]|nr:27 kDa antigen Cfp30B [Frondihabitans sp.]
MTDDLTFPTGAPIWVDLSSSDVAASRAFYEALFGWTSTDTGPEYGNYVVFSLGDKQVGGLIGRQEPAEAPDAWLVYLETDDAETTSEAVTGAGGVVLSGPHPVGSLGSMVIATDVDRATVGAWQRGDNRGIQARGEVGTPAWFELHTTQYDDSLQFYQQAFGWQTVSMAGSPEFRYTQLMVDDEPYAGVMDASGYWPAGDPAAWVVYFRVADADAAAARAVELGGSVVEAPTDTPFGRLATLTDVTGATIKLIEGGPNA